jgi:hypothetical protein
MWFVVATVPATSVWPAATLVYAVQVATLAVTTPTPPSGTTSGTTTGTTTDTTSTTGTSGGGTTTPIRELPPSPFTGGSDRFAGGAAVDVLRALGGDDFIWGRGGNDVIYGEDGNDQLDGGAGDDQVHGGTGLDIIDGGIGNDLLTCGPGRHDVAAGGAGNDRIGCADRRGGDEIDGGFGVDTCIGDRTDVFRRCERIVRK